MESPLRVDVEAILKGKAPNTKVPRFLVNYLKKIIHQDEINAYLASNPGYGLDFVDSTLKFLQADAVLYGAEHFPPKDEKVIFVSNHPLGGLDGVVLSMMIGRNFNEHIKVFVNDILMYLKPMDSLFVPANKTGAQKKDYAVKLNEVYTSENNLLTFPAGMCSRKIKGVVQDLEWRKNFVVKAVQYQRNVVPLYFEGRNSNFFYNLAMWRKRLGIKLNIEMLYLVDEMFKQRGSHFVVRVGEPILWQTFDSSKTPTEWAQWVKAKVYDMK